jgi:predicted O-linked N-acetylglucosamine transferase (SPINDLY family)
MFNWIRKKAEKDGDRAARSASASVVAGAHPASAQLKERGDVHLKAGRLAEAEACYREVLAGAAGHAEALVNLGFVLCAQGRGGEARGVLERALAVAPEDADAHYLLAGVLAGSGESAAAIRELQQAVALRAGFEPAYCDLIVQLYQARRLTEAVSCCEAGLAALPASAQLYFYRSNLYLEAGDRSAALAACQTALRLEPGLLAARQSASRLLFEAERLDEALASYRAEIELDPQVAGAHHQAGVCLIQLGRVEEAIGYFKGAIAIESGLAASYYCLGGAYRKIDQLAEDNLAVAQAYFERAVALAPEVAEFRYGLGLIQQERAQLDEAQASYAKAIQLDGQHVGARWAAVMLCAPPFFGEDGTAERGRGDFLAALAEFRAWWVASDCDGLRFVGAQQPFFLTYQEEDNLPLLRPYGTVCVEAMQRWFERQQFPALQPTAHTRIRVGIVSADVRMHSVWMALIKGWIEYLDRERFEIVVFSLSERPDVVTDWARAHSERFVSGPKSLRQWVESIRAEAPQILIFPAVGLDQLTTQLACLRLAPTQVNAWGHPDTSGLPTLDYYLSAECFEPAGAEGHYSETLVCLPHLGNPYQALGVDSEPPDFQKLGLDPDRPLLICPGSAFKYQPRHDQVFVELVRRLPDCQLVFFRGYPPDLPDQLRARLERRFASAGLDGTASLRFIPFQTFHQYHGLMKCADVMLDSIGFSGYNNAIQAIECGLPVVTREGRFLRGRLASGILRRMGLTELIAAGLEGYVDTVARLVLEPAYREQVRAAILARRAILFDDITPMGEFQAFLESAASSRQAVPGYGPAGAP